jgi:hypothetical protein
VLRVPEPLPRTGARKLLPGVLGPHPVARPAAARPHRAACHPCACGGGVPGPSLGLAVAVLREARETGFRTAAMSRGRFHCRSWDMCRPSGAGVGACAPDHLAMARRAKRARGTGARARRAKSLGRPRPAPHAIWPNPAQGSPPPGARPMGLPSGRSSDRLRAGRARRLCRARPRAGTRRTPDCRCSPGAGEDAAPSRSSLRNSPAMRGGAACWSMPTSAAAGSAIAWALARRPARSTCWTGPPVWARPLHGEVGGSTSCPSGKAPSRARHCLSVGVRGTDPISPTAMTMIIASAAASGNAGGAHASAQADGVVFVGGLGPHAAAACPRLSGSGSGPACPWRRRGSEPREPAPAWRYGVTRPWQDAAAIGQGGQKQHKPGILSPKDPV